MHGSQAIPQGDDFSVVLIPDTQFYSRKDPETYRKQTQFIVDSAARLNTRVAIHLGDITDKNTQLEWDRASQAHETLDVAGLPYSITTGNHDYESVTGERRRRRVATRFRATFPASRYASRDWFGGHYGGGVENNYVLFSGAQREFIVMSLEYAPPKNAMCWASQVLRQHSDRRAIVATHCYQNADGSYNTNCDLDEDRNMVGADGRAIWNEFVRQHPNVFLVVSGHVNGSKHTIRSRETGLIAGPSTRDTVHELLTDFQGQHGRHATPRIDEEHGDGWLRILQFHPNRNRVSVRDHVVSHVYYWMACGLCCVFVALNATPIRALSCTLQLLRRRRLHRHSG